MTNPRARDIDLLTLALDSLLDAVVIIDRHGDVLAWNPIAEATFGWTASEAVGHSMSNLIVPPHHREGHSQGMARFLNTGIAHVIGRRIEISAVDRGDREFPIELSIVALQLDDETVFIGFLRDISARVAAEARDRFMLELTELLRLPNTNATLQGACQLLGTHFGVSRVGYGHLDPVDNTFDYDVCWTDGQVPPLLGRFPAEAFGAKIVARLMAGHTVVVEDLLEDPLSDEAVTRQTANDVDTRAILVVPFVRDGRLRTIVYLNDARPRSWTAAEMVFMQDVAERTRQTIEREAAERALQELNVTLEARVEQRTAELARTEEQLRQAQKMEAVGQLTGGVAHDFNNLLTIIGSSANFLQRPNLPEDRRLKYLDAIVQTVERATRLTSQLLAFARRQPLNPELFEVHDQVAVIIDLIRPLVGPNVEIRPPAAYERPHCIRADRGQFETALVNLAVNARDAMEGAGTLIFAVAIEDRSGNGEPTEPYVGVSVTDTGCGIPEENLQSIFEPFYTTKEVGKGTGLGLSQVFGFAKQSGGEVRVASRVSVGTTFTLLLPLVDRTNDDDQPIGTQEPAALAKGLRILVVEDNRDVGAFATEMLHDLGCTTEWFIDARSALARLAQGVDDFDAVFSDIVMPGMTGLELAAQIGRDHPHLRIVLASGYSSALADSETLEHVVIRKPYTLCDLANALAQALIPN